MARYPPKHGPTSAGGSHHHPEIINGLLARNRGVRADGRELGDALIETETSRRLWDNDQIIVRVFVQLRVIETVARWGTITNWL